MEKDKIAANFRAIKGQLFGTEELEAEQSRLQEELNVAAELIDEEQWYSLVDFITVFNKEDVRFTFKDGTEIKV